MNTPEQEITPVARFSGDLQISVPELSLIERLAASHAAVLEKWHRNFALDLRRPPTVPPENAAAVATGFYRP